MPLGYNTNGYDPNEKHGKAEEGDYAFKVDEAEETTFKSGNRGLKIKLLVAALENRDITVFVNLVYTDKARWKLNQFLTSIGLDFMNPPEVHDLVNRNGFGHFAPGGDKGYLEAGEFFAPEGGAAKGPAAPAGQYNYGPPAFDKDQVPF